MRLNKLKALILAGGRGKRLNEASIEQNKCMLRLRDKPLIEYSLENAAKDEVEEIVIVVGYRAEDIINYFGNKYKGIKITYALQWEQKGLVNAIECSRDRIGKADFMLFLADEVLTNPNHSEMVKRFKEESLFAVCGVVIVEDAYRIRNTYSVIQSDQDDRIYRLIEKPRNPLNNIMGTGNCIFKNEIFEYIQYTPINQQRGEKELPDLIQCAIDDGRIVESFNIGDNYININTHNDLEQVEQYNADNLIPTS